jgi:hypothetical protein
MGRLAAGERAMVLVMRVVNVLEAELEQGPGRDGFWFRAEYGNDRR